MHCLYRHFDSTGKLLYVGISINSLRRLADHGRHSFWFDQIRSITLDHFDSRPEVLAAERAAIAAENPVYNRMRPGLRRVLSRRPEEMRDRIPAGKNVFKSHDISEVLGVSLDSARGVMKSGDITCLLVGKVQKVVLREDLLKYIDSLAS